MMMTHYRFCSRNKFLMNVMFLIIVGIVTGCYGLPLPTRVPMTIQFHPMRGGPAAASSVKNSTNGTAALSKEEQQEDDTTAKRRPFWRKRRAGLRQEFNKIRPYLWRIYCIQVANDDFFRFVSRFPLGKTFTKCFYHVTDWTGNRFRYWYGRVFQWTHMFIFRNPDSELADIGYRVLVGPILEDVFCRWLMCSLTQWSLRLWNRIVKKNWRVKEPEVTANAAWRFLSSLWFGITHTDIDHIWENAPTELYMDHVLHVVEPLEIDDDSRDNVEAEFRVEHVAKRRINYESNELWQLTMEYGIRPCTRAFIASQLVFCPYFKEHGLAKTILLHSAWNVMSIPRVKWLGPLFCFCSIAQRNLGQDEWIQLDEEPIFAFFERWLVAHFSLECLQKLLSMLLNDTGPYPDGDALRGWYCSL